MRPNDLVSVIVPVYNVKQYLEECFTSICNQTYQHLEIILVDDGSTDGSGDLCDELVKRDPRSRVLHKPNGGLSDARNYGLRFANGDWVSFVDSDDYVSPVFIEILLNACLETGCQISAVPFGKPFDDGDSCALLDSVSSVAAAKVLPSPEVQRLMLYQALDNGAQWRLYTKESLGIDPFPKGLYYEDLASIYKIIHKVDTVAVVDCRELYAYRMRNDSIIRQEYKHIKGKSALIVAQHLYKDILAWYPELQRAAASRCFSVCRMVFAQLPTVSNDSLVRGDSSELWRMLKKYRQVVLIDGRARKRERLAAGVAYLGKIPFQMFCLLCRAFGLMR